MMNNITEIKQDEYEYKNKIFKVGDVITACTPGYHRIVGFFELESDYPSLQGLIAPQVKYVTIINGKGNPLRGKKEKSCHIGYCAVVDHNYIDDLQKEDTKKVQDKCNALRKIINESSSN